MKKLIYLLSFLFCSTALFSQTHISGKITDKDIGEELIGANISIFKKGTFITGTSTDFDGNYKATLDPGTYRVEVSYIGYPKLIIEDIILYASQANEYDFALGSGDEWIMCDFGCVFDYVTPLIHRDHTTSETIVTNRPIQQQANKNIAEIISTVAGVSFQY